MSKKGKYMFSRHAFDRLQERTKITAEEIAILFDNNVYLNLGAKPGLIKHHILFYSKDDNDFYVAIQDNLNGDIITILPLDYHSNLAWGVTERDKEKVLLKYKEYEKKLETPLETAKYNIKIHFLFEEKFKSLDVSNKALVDYESSVERLLNDQGVQGEIKEVIKKNKIEVTDDILISVRIGRKGKPTYYNLIKTIGENYAHSKS